ncbi:MAG: DUF4836 family protein [Ferruginibacter sp.]
MQKNSLLKLIVFCAITMVLASCSKSNTQGRYIPKEAAAVIMMDGKSLTAKLPWDEIKQNPLFKEAYGDSSLPPAIKSLLENPASAGIDPQTDLLFFTIKDSLGGYFAFEGTVKDAAAFKAFNQKVTENGSESEKGDIQFISKAPVCVGFTKDKFIYIINAPQMAQMDDLSRRMMRDSIDMPTISARDISLTCQSVFDLSESNSLAKNEHFTSLTKESGDMHFWINFEEIGKTTGSTNALAMLNMERFNKGNVTTGTVNFENGKMAIKIKSYASDDLMKIFKKYSGGKINEDMVKRLPGKDMMAVMAVNFKPEGLMELVKLTGFDGLVNIGLKSLGFTIEDFVKANKGDVVVGFSDLTIKTDSASLMPENGEPNFPAKQTPDFNFVFSASIGDKDAFNKLVDAGKKMGGAALDENGNSKISYNSNGTFFALGNSKENVDKFLASPSNSFDFLDKMSGEPFGGYLNIQSLLKSFGSLAQKDSAAKVAYDANLSMWDNIVWKGGNYSDGGITQNIEVNLVDKSTNSLKQFNNYAAKMALFYKENKKKQWDEMKAYDEEMAVPIDSAVSPMMNK